LDTLGNMATILRSKNAGPFMTTVDLFFSEESNYRRVKQSKVLTPQHLSALYRIPESAVVGVMYMDRINGIKITIVKPGFIASGDLGCGDTFGCQQYVPLVDTKIP
jgi:Domain of unknown function (DUF4387)